METCFYTNGIFLLTLLRQIFVGINLKKTVENRKKLFSEFSYKNGLHALKTIEKHSRHELISFGLPLLVFNYCKV